MQAMPDFFTIKTIAKIIALPPTGLILVTLLGLCLIPRFPRAGRGIAFIATILLLILSSPFASHQLIKLLDTFPPLDLKETRLAQAIIIPGAGIDRNMLEYGDATLGQLTLERVRYGAKIARTTGLPILVSGGSIQEGEQEATLMKAALEEEFGIKVRWSESQSRNTHENAMFSASILQKEGIRHVILVTHSYHMARAKTEFSSAGLLVVPAPTQILNQDPTWPSSFIPGISGLQTSYYICYELLAKLFMKTISLP